MAERITGTYRDGYVYPDKPVDWPEGMRVVVEVRDDDYGIDEGEKSKEADDIARGDDQRG